MTTISIEYAVECRECGQQYFQSKCPGDLCEDHSLGYERNPLQDSADGRRNVLSQERKDRSKASRRATLARRNSLFERDKWTCHLCDKPIDRALAWPHNYSPVLDHIVPKSHGGSGDPENLRAAHALCNNVRGTIDVDVFRAGWGKPGR